MKMMDLADSPRRGDRDGRGNLSTTALREFSQWFLSVVLEEIRLSSSTFDLASLESRLARVIGVKQARTICAVLMFGPLDHEGMKSNVGEAAQIRGIVGELTASGFLRPIGGSARFSAQIPLEYCEALFPDLFISAPPLGETEDRLPRP
jgi:hypothetical protein